MLIFKIMKCSQKLQYNLNLKKTNKIQTLQQLKKSQTNKKFKNINLIIIISLISFKEKKLPFRRWIKLVKHPKTSNIKSL